MRNKVKYNILIATYPFGQCGKESVNIFKKTGWNLHYNSLGRRLKTNEVKDMIYNMDAVIAGTEPYNKEVLKNSNKLKVICRVGVGLDNIDFEECRNRNIEVTHTPVAPANGVADLTVAQIINLLRGIVVSNQLISKKIWKRTLGLLVSEAKIGVLGVGRIGSRVIKRLKSFDANPIYCCDLKPYSIKRVKWLNKEELFKTCDLVTIHIPYNRYNHHCVDAKEINMMKKGSFIINTSRGLVLNEKALEDALTRGHLGGAALDVFKSEPYRGVMTKMDNVILTAHIGSSARMARFLMEYGASTDCIRFLKGIKPLNIAPNEII